MPGFSYARDLASQKWSMISIGFPDKVERREVPMNRQRISEEQIIRILQAYEAVEQRRSPGSIESANGTAAALRLSDVVRDAAQRGLGA